MQYNLNSALSSGGSGNLTSVLTEETKKIKEDIKKKRIKNNLTDLEIQLNDLFYPKGKITSISSYYKNQLDQLTTNYEITLEDKLNNYEFSEDVAKRYKPSKSEKMKKSTLLKEIEYLESLKGEINRIENKTEKIKEILKFIDKTKTILQNNLTEIEEIFGDESKIIIQKDSETIANTINKVRALKHFLEQGVIGQKAFGDLFEQALALVNTNIINMTEKEAENLLKNNITQSKKFIFGDKNVKRGETGILIQEIDEKLYDKQENSKFKLENGKYILEYNPSQEKQGKLDVLIKLDDNLNDGFRISAKNWSQGKGDLGTTSIEYGINRIGSQESVYAYKYGLLLKNTDDLKKVHNFAKLALKADIAMGLSQIYGENNGLGGYANVLVINNSKKEHIYVKDLAEIVNSTELSGYDDSTINSDAQKILRYKINHLKKERSKNYIGLITSTLFKMLVTIELNTNNWEKATKETTNTNI